MNGRVSMFRSQCYENCDYVKVLITCTHTLTPNSHYDLMNETKLNNVNEKGSFWVNTLHVFR